MFPRVRQQVALNYNTTKQTHISYLIIKLVLLFSSTQYQCFVEALSSLPTSSTGIKNNNTIRERIGLKGIQQIMGQAISATQFFVYGKRHFTQTGYLKHVQEYTKPYQLTPSIGIGQDGADGVDLTNKVVVVTGANSGLGKMVSTYCVAKGAKLYMICRDSTRGEQAKQDIIKETQTVLPDNIKIILADVAELHQVRKAVTEIQQYESSIHALVCNAGVLLNTKQVTSENNEITFACHLLGGTYLLTNLLLPQLRNSQGTGRVVIVTSGGMYNTPIPSWDIMTSSSSSTTTTKYDGTMAYAYAKRGQVVLAEQWAKEYGDNDVKFVTVHPGWTDTPAVEEAFGDNKKYLAPLREPWQGAEGVAWLVGTSISDIQNGELYLDRLVQKKHIAGPFMSEGSYTKNTSDDITKFLQNLKQVAGLE